MAQFQKTFTSKAPSQGVSIDLRSRLVGPANTVEHFALVRVEFDGGDRAVEKEVKIDDLTPAQAADLKAGALALHAAALAQISGDDFR